MEENIQRLELMFKVAQGLTFIVLQKFNLTTSTTTYSLNKRNKRMKEFTIGSMIREIGTNDIGRVIDAPSEENCNKPWVVSYDGKKIRYTTKQIESGIFRSLTIVTP